MTHLALKSGFIWMAALFCCVGGTQGRTIREVLDVLLATEYCGEVMMDGWDMSTAIRGESPISDDSVFDVPEEAWLPVLLEMAGEELEACKRDTVEDIAGIRRWEAAGEIRDNSDDEGSRFLWKAHWRVQGRRNKLMKMVICLQYAEGGTQEVLDILERIGLESPPEFDLALRVAISFVRKACRDGQFTRCLEFGRRCRNPNGPGNDQEWEICHEVGHYALPRLKEESDRRNCYQYMLEFAETVSNIYIARGFDEMALGAIPGWAGSLQRRLLAARFPDEPIPHHMSYNMNTKELVVGEIDESELPKLLNHRAAAELAADESDLTDLREVYGDWAQKAEEE